MAKEKDGGNSYTPIRNPELRQGQPETRTIPEMAAGEKKAEIKKENEGFVQMHERREQTQVRQPAIHEQILERQKQVTPQTEKHLQKDKQQDKQIIEPEKD